MDKLLKDMKINLRKLKKKLSEFFDLKNPEKRKNIITLGSVLGVIIFLTVIYLVTTKNISSIEKNALMKQSDDVIFFLDYIDEDDVSTDDYILFALKYSQENNGRSILSSTEISDLIKDKMNKEIKPEDIKATGITDTLLNENIIYNSGDDTFEMSISRKNAGTIAKTAVNYYKVKKVSKINKRKYNIVYQKYIIDNPYETLNYYINYNAENNDLVDISTFRNYLSGSDSVFKFKKAIRTDDIDKYSKKDKKIKVTYIVNDDKLLIDKVSRCTLC